MAQFLVEEALFEMLDGVKLAVLQEEQKRSEMDDALADAHRRAREALV